MAIDLFRTRTMLKLLEQIFPPKTFLLDTFFPTVEMSMSEKVDIDVYKGARRLAPFVKWSGEPKQIERIGYKTNSFVPPYIKVEMIFTAEELIKRAAGSHIYMAGASPLERAAEILAKDLAEMQNNMTRREEWMAAQVLNTGKIVIQGEGYDAEIDFGMDSSHKITLSGSDLWTDANSTPIDDLREWFDLIGKDSGLNPEVAVMGKVAANNFVNNQSVRQLLDNRRIEMGQIDPRLLPNGAIFLGTLKDPSLDVYRYNEYYFDEGSSTTKPMIPDNKVWMGSTRARTARHYGMIMDIEAPASVRWYPKTVIDSRKGIRFLILQSAPLVAMHQPDGFVSAQVTA